MTYEQKNLFVQADLRTVRGSTTERKKMSTKTSFKRIALVAVASLGLGVLTSVSANAATTVTGKISVTSSSTAINKATNDAVTASTSAAPALFTAVAGSTVTVTVDSDAYTNGEVTATIGTNSDFTTGQAALTTTHAAVDTTESKITFTAPAVDDTYYVKIVGVTAGAAYLKLTTIDMGAKIGDGFSSVAGTATVSSATSSTVNAVAGPANTVTLSGLRNAAAGKAGLVTVSGGSSTISSVSAGGTIAANYLSAQIAAGTLAAVDIVLATPAVGTITANYYEETSAGSGIFSATASSTVTITVNATANSGVIAGGKSATVLVATGTTLTNYDSYAEISAGTDLTSAVDGRVSGVSSAIVAGIVQDALGNPVSGATIAASVSGPGTVSASVDGTTSQALSDGGKIDSITTGASGVYYIRVYADGSAGVSTITVTSGTNTLGTKKVTFYGTATKISATQNLYNVAAGSTLGKATAAGDATGADVANTYAATIKVTDANGNPAIGTVSAVSSDTSVIDAAACTASSVTTGTYNCEVHAASGATVGKSATVTWRVLLSDGTTYASTSAVTFKIGGTAAKATVAPAAAAYAPGSEVTLVVTVTDANGNAAADLDTNIFAAGIKSSVSLTKAWGDAGAGEVNVAVIGGVAKLKFYAPLTAGPVVIDLPVEAAFNLSGTITKLTATVNVSESAATTGLTALINSLIKKINDLSKLVAKIQKKLGVK